MTEEFSGRDLAGARFRRVNLGRAAFELVTFAGAAFEQVTFAGARFHQVDLSGVRIRSVYLRDLDIGGEVERLLVNLVFATDAWVGRAMLGDPSPWDPLDRLWDEMPDIAGTPSPGHA